MAGYEGNEKGHTLTWPARTTTPIVIITLAAGNVWPMSPSGGYVVLVGHFYGKQLPPCSQWHKPEPFRYITQAGICIGYPVSEDETQALNRYALCVSGKMKGFAQGRIDSDFPCIFPKCHGSLVGIWI